MSLLEINAEQVESFLRAMRSGSAWNEPLLSHDSLFEITIKTREERSLVMYDRLEQLVRENYLESRRQEDLPSIIPEDRKVLVARVQEDFSCGNADLEAWSTLYFRYFTPINIGVEDLAQTAHVVPQQLRRRLNLSLAFVVQFLHRQVLEARYRQSDMGRFLPLPDTVRLIGVQDTLERLTALFHNPSGPALVSLEGIGGIGKTAVARAFAALPEVGADWPVILWVSARQSSVADDGSVVSVVDPATTLEDISIRLAEQLGLSSLEGKPLPERIDGLRAALNSRKTLTVVDNLETIQEYQALIPALARLAGNSRFLITSRQTLRAFPYVHVIQLAELSRDNTSDLLQIELARRGRPAKMDEENFSALYEVVGGIPLAIKLAAAQLMLRPLHEILTSLQQADHGTDKLYRYLYWQTWNSLGDSSKRLLLTFLTADPEGEDIDFLYTMSGQSGEDFYSALQELDQFSLLEVGGNASRPLYRLHRLTVTFLQTDVLNRW